MKPGNLDNQIFLIINGFVDKVPIFDDFTRLIVNEYFVPVSLALLILYLWFAKHTQRGKRRQGLSLALFSIGLVNVIIVILNQFVARARPFDALDIKLLFYEPTDPSFPSNAAAVSFALASAIFFVDKRLGVFALSLATLYSFSRIYAGVHFPSDVVVGAVIGVSSTFFISRFPLLIKYLTKFIESVQEKLKLNLDF